MRRWIYRVISALSAIVFIALIGAWVQSRESALFIGQHQRMPLPGGQMVTDRQRGLLSHGGEVGWVDSTYTMSSYMWMHFNSSVDDSLNTVTRDYFHDSLWGSRKRDGVWSKLGFVVASDTHSGMTKGSLRLFLVPHWFALLLAAIPPFLHVMFFLRLRHRRISNRCLKCSYDLRACTDRCPECGEPIPSPPVPAVTP